jgi:hypothetical protein
MSQSVGAAVPLIVLMMYASASSDAISQTRVVSPTYPTRGIISPRRFDPFAVAWRTSSTAHFDIYHTGYGALDAIARDAESAYARLSADVRHELPTRVPLILLPTTGDLPDGRMEVYAIVRASGAPDRDHVLLPVDAPERRFTALVHELSHVFQSSLLPDARILRWAAEGFADHETGVWRQADLAMVRRAASAGAVPAIAELNDTERAWGHVLADFVAAEFGPPGLRTFLTAFGESASAQSAIIQTGLGLSAADFDKRFRTYVSERFGRR